MKIIFEIYFIYLFFYGKEISLKKNDIIFTIKESLIINI